MRRRTWAWESVRALYLSACLIWHWHKTTGAKKMIIKLDTLKEKVQPKHSLAWLFMTSALRYALNMKVLKKRRRFVFVASPQNLRRLDALRDSAKTLLLLLS